MAASEGVRARKENMKCALFPLLLLLTGCSSRVPQPASDWSKDSIRMMEQARYLGMQADCLHPPLTQEQQERAAGLAHYRAQQYLFALAATEDISACQQRALQICEQSAPGLCLAPPD
jgi:hypothetical protein